jgi:predicted ATPase
MKVQINSLGALRYAELALGEMTIICGANNTGKTYAAYALYGFLYLWRDLITISIPQKKTSELLNNGVVTIEISPYIDNIESILFDGCKKYSGQLSHIFATSAEKLKEASFSLTLDFNKDKHIKTKEQYERRISYSNR